MKFTGITSRDTPEKERVFLSVVTERLISEDYLVRTGGAGSYTEPFLNAVKASMVDVEGKKKTCPVPMELFLPYKEQGELSPNNKTVFDIAQLREVQSGKALSIINRFQNSQHGAVNYPADWDAFVPALLGKDLDDKSKFLICWAPQPEFDSNNRINNCAGDMSVVVRMAHSNGINVFNTAVPTHKRRLLKWITGDKR